ncbi:hypothetical protein LTS18_005126 [Coniosporium uncinatum]|uniref:Uncharacterized protein n=1 Tax=Coniosporium uncinatum TaxID=93489 RepID=A0ACC3DRQ9_9PEZI|nr:hypothetical protein LTS18_005126 [Coniosporium uncinatum]
MYFSSSILALAALSASLVSAQDESSSNTQPSAPISSARATITSSANASATPTLHSVSWPYVSVQQTFSDAGAASAAVSRLASDLSTFLTSLTADPAYASQTSVLYEALPSSLRADIDSDVNNAVEQLATQTAAPSWFSALPTENSNYWVSVANEEIAIATKAIEGVAARPTGYLKAAGVVAAGAVGVAGLIL